MLKFFTISPALFIRVLAATLLVTAVIPQTILSSPPARAASICNVDSLTPHDPPANSDTGFDFQITMNGSDAQWIKVTVPHPNVSLYDVSSNDWPTIVVAPGHTTFTDGLVPDAGTTFLHVVGTVGDYFPASNWLVQVSSDPSGASPQTCDGDVSLAPVDLALPVISGLNASATATTATIRWQTDKPTTSLVSYGPNSGYGSQASAGGFVSSHSVTITGLSPSSAYNFMVTSSDSAGNVTTSADSTFQTASQAAATVVNVISPGAPNVPGVVVKAVPTESQPPVVALTQVPAAPAKSSPRLNGSASDNDVVARVEYSLDGGKNWLPVDQIVPVGKATKPAERVNFSFTPIIQEDGNYEVMARATDASGNQALTSVSTIVLDRLEPRAGPLVVSYGPYILQPDTSGETSLEAGTSYKVTSSVVGGPTSLTLAAQRAGATNSSPAVFAMAPDNDSGLWQASMQFSSGGHYEVFAMAVDGAGNQTKRKILQAYVMSPGRVVDAATAKPIAGSQIVVRARETSSSPWRTWSGASYNQPNPQTSSGTGEFSLMLPRGTYYLTAKARGYASYTSSIFTITQPSVIGSTLSLKPSMTLGLGSLKLTLPSLSWKTQALAVTAARTVKPNPLVGSLVPDFSLPISTGGVQTALGLTGKPTIITVLATWSPDATDQLTELTSLQSNQDVNIVPILSQQRTAAVASYLATSGTNLKAVVDPDGTLVDAFGTSALPQHVFVDRTGRIKKVTVGVLSRADILSQLGGL